MDEAFFMPSTSVRSRHLTREVVPLVTGEVVRDHVIGSDTVAFFPYDNEGKPRAASREAEQELWPLRRVLETGLDFGHTKSQRGLRWFDHSMFFAERYRIPLSIAFAEVATHNHFVLDRGGKVFKQTAPVIKLNDGASEEAHLLLLGLLNSSTACFWLKQVSYGKGNGGIGGGIGDEPWEPRFAFNPTKLEHFPIPIGAPLDLARRLDSLARQVVMPSALCRRGARHTDPGNA